MVPVRRSSSPVAVVALLGANLLPLAGVVWWDWSVFEVLVLYWLESGVVGALNVPKILLAGGGGQREGEDRSGTERPGPSAIGPLDVRVEGLPTEWLGRQSATTERVGLAAFFVVHYGVFWVVHGVFVFALPLFALGGQFGGGPFDAGPSAASEAGSRVGACGPRPASSCWRWSRWSPATPSRSRPTTSGPASTGPSRPTSR